MERIAAMRSNAPATPYTSRGRMRRRGSAAEAADALTGRKLATAPNDRPRERCGLLTAQGGEVKDRADEGRTGGTRAKLRRLEGRLRDHVAYTGFFSPIVNPPGVNPAKAGTCRKLQVLLVDGTLHTALFSFM
jgi:hypothetical protein